eukprot:scaffold56860_cov18-Tisochrysis_lutea.AAC.1
MPVLEALAMDPVSCALCCFLELMCVGVNARIHTQSLCYNLPILEALAMDPDSCALYCFPTKALAQVRRQWHKNCACAPGQTMLAREKKSAAMKLCRAAAPCAAFQAKSGHISTCHAKMWAILWIPEAAAPCAAFPLRRFHGCGNQMIVERMCISMSDDFAEVWAASWIPAAAALVLPSH